MRQFKNYEAVKVNNAEEAMEFLQYLEAFTNLRWPIGDKPTGVSRTFLSHLGFPIFIYRAKDSLWLSKLEYNLDYKTKIIPLSEFLEPKVTYTREQAEAVFEDSSLFHNGLKILGRKDIAFLNHKFPKSTLEQVTEAVKDLGNFTIEQTSTGEIIISPIKN